MSVFEALGISVGAGFIVLILIGTSRILWWWSLENIYLKITCRHMTDISGNWIGEYTDPRGHKCTEDLELKQYGPKLKGTSVYRIVYVDDRPDNHKRFNLHGLLRNDLFTAYYWNIDRRQKGSGVLI